MPCYATLIDLCFIFSTILLCFLSWRCHVLLCHVAACYVTPRDAMYTILHNAISYRAVLCLDVPCHIGSCKDEKKTSITRRIFFITSYLRILIFSSTFILPSFYSTMSLLHSGKFIMVKSDDVAAAMTRLFSTQVRTCTYPLWDAMTISSYSKNERISFKFSVV